MVMCARKKVTAQDTKEDHFLGDQRYEKNFIWFRPKTKMKNFSKINFFESDHFAHFERI